MQNISQIDVLLPPRYRPNGETIDIVTAIREGAWMGTVNLWLYRQHDGRLQILFQQRDHVSPSNPGLLDLSAAGYLHAGYDGRSGAVAEAAEELGVTLEPNQLVAMGRHQTALLDQRGRERRLVSESFICQCDLPLERFAVAEAEVPAIFWVDAEAFLSLEDGSRQIEINGRSSTGETITRQVGRDDFVYNLSDYHYRMVERISWFCKA